jgi:putative transposase
MVTTTYITGKTADRAVPGIRQFKTNPEPEEILRAVSAVLGGNEKRARQVGMYFCHRYSGKKLRDIGTLFGVGETTIAEARRLFERKMEKDEKLRVEFEKIKTVLRI